MSNNTSSKSVSRNVSVADDNIDTTNTATVTGRNNSRGMTSNSINDTNSDSVIDDNSNITGTSYIRSQPHVYSQVHSQRTHTQIHSQQHTHIKPYKHTINSSHGETSDSIDDTTGNTSSSVNVSSNVLNKLSVSMTSGQGSNHAYFKPTLVCTDTNTPYSIISISGEYYSVKGINIYNGPARSNYTTDLSIVHASYSGVYSNSSTYGDLDLHLPASSTFFAIIDTLRNMIVDSLVTHINTHIDSGMLPSTAIRYIDAVAPNVCDMINYQDYKYSDNVIVKLCVTKDTVFVDEHGSILRHEDIGKMFFKHYEAKVVLGMPKLSMTFGKNKKPNRMPLKFVAAKVTYRKLTKPVEYTGNSGNTISSSNHGKLIEAMNVLHI